MIIDFMHLVHTYMYAPYEIKAYIEIDGEVRQVSVKLHQGILSTIHKWTRHGKDKVIVCMDRPVPARKAYFTKINMEMGIDKGYKEGRKSLPANVWEAVDQITAILREIGIPVCVGENYEADDLIFSVLSDCKKKYPDTPIDIITNDADLLPLVDEQVSVFIKSTKFSSAVEPELLKKHYIQITPENFEAEVTQRGEYKKFRVPYNTLLLHKLIRGDKSDNIPMLKGYPPKKYNAMIEQMEKDGINFSEVFRYGECPKQIIDKQTGQILESSEGRAKGTFKIKYLKPVELDNILEIMSNYMSVDDLKHIERIYKGINLNQAYVEPVANGVRLPARVNIEPREYSEDKFKAVMEKWNIRIWGTKK